MTEFSEKLLQLFSAYEIPASEDQAAALERYAEDVYKRQPVGSVERRRAMAVKENEQIKLNKLNKKLKMEKMPQGPERENAEKTFARHEKFDAMKKLVGAFKKANPLSRAEAVYRDAQDDKTYVHKGRAFFGGTKPMYIFEDSQGPVSYTHLEQVGIYLQQDPPL